MKSLLLVVDDNKKIRNLIKLICSEFFEKIVEAEDGEEGVDLYSKLRPDYALLDIQMKRLDGLTAAKNIIKDDPHAKVLIFSQFDEDEYKNKSEEIGALRFFSKKDLMSLRKFFLSELNLY